MFDLKSFDWRSLKRLADPKSASDLNAFIEGMPQMAGQTVLIAAGIAWAAAAALGLYASVETKALIELRAELKNTETLRPVVPVIRDVPVNAAQIKTYAEQMQAIYSGLQIRPQGAGVFIASNVTSNFGEFREAVGHLQNGGAGWRVTIDRLCVGRECEREKLAALLRVNTVSVD